MHLRLPRYGESAPTLEIFSYGTNEAIVPGGPNRAGFGHVAFVVDDVAAARANVLAAGGSAHGEIVTTPAGARRGTWVYLRDPEGNLLELQSWSDGV